MIYFLESPYIKKLFISLSMHRSDLTLLPINQVHVCTHEDVVILDEMNLNALPNHVKKYKILGEGQGHISKFQPYKEIAKLLLDVTFPIVLVTSNYITPELVHTVQTLWHRLDFDYFVDCTLNAENAFSLYNYAMNPSYVPEKKKKYAVINHLKDATKPPIEDICRFITHLKQTGSLFAFSAPIKGPLDISLISLADGIVNLVHEGHPMLALSEITSKPYYTLPISSGNQIDKTFEKNVKNIIMDMKSLWGDVLETL